MRRNLKHALLALPSFLGVLATPTAGYGAVVRFSPDWATSMSDVAPNQSFLDDLDGPGDALQSADIIGRAQADKMRLEYEDMSRRQEMRDAYSLSTPQESRTYMDRMESFTRHVLRSIFSYHVQEKVETASRNSSEVRTFNKVSQTMQKMNIKLDEQFEFGTRTDLPNQKGSLWVRSPLVDGAFDVNLGTQWLDPAEASLNKIDPRSPNNERYRVSVSKRLSDLGLGTGLTYGFDSTLMTASVSKALTGNLSCELLTRRGLNETRAGMTGSEQAVKFQYRLKF